MFLIRLSRIFVRARDNFLFLAHGARKNIMLYLFVAFSIGIVVNEYYRPSVWLGFYGSLIFVFMMIVAVRKIARFFAMLFVVFIFLGMIYCRAAAFLPEDHIFHIARKVSGNECFFIGTVDSDVKRSHAFGGVQQFEFRLAQMIDQKGRMRPVKGKILVKLFHQIKVSSKDILWIHGGLYPPFEYSSAGKSSYRDYLRRRKIYYMLSVGRKGTVDILLPGHGFFRNNREAVKNNFNRFLGKFEASLMRAIILGDRTGIDRDVRDIFSKTGTAHILAISGLHMSIMLMVFLFILGFVPLSMRVKYFLAIILLVIYFPFTGGRVSVLRSGIMSIVLLYSFIVERRACSLNTIGLAGLVILLIDPQALYTIGFQLSFSAVMSLIVFYPPVALLAGKVFSGWPTIFVQSFSASACAWLGVAGWVAYYFGLITPIGLLANVVVIFFMPWIVALGILLSLAGMAGFQGLAGIFAGSITFMLRALVYAVLMFSRIPCAYFGGIEMSKISCVVYYILLVCMALGISMRTRKESPLKLEGFLKLN